MMWQMGPEIHKFPPWKTVWRDNSFRVSWWISTIEQRFSCLQTSNHHTGLSFLSPNVWWLLLSSSSSTPVLTPQGLPPTPPPVRGMGCSIELTCNFEPDTTVVIMIDGARDVGKMARIEKNCDDYTNTLPEGWICNFWPAPPFLHSLDLWGIPFDIPLICGGISFQKEQAKTIPCLSFGTRSLFLWRVKEIAI